MPTSSESSRSGTPVLLSAPGLSVVALVLFVLFASLVAPALLASWPWPAPPATPI